MSRRAQGVLVLFALVLLAAAPASAAPAPVATVVIDGVISPVTLRPIESALPRAKAGGAQALAIQRGRNAEWGEKALRQSVSVTEREAVRLMVVDFIADSIPDLLTKLDGRTVKTSQGPVTLATREAVAKPIEIGFRDRVLAVI